MTERVGIVASCFDLFHAGHILMLTEAKENCDRLVVALQSDPTIDRPEKNKPIQSVVERWVQVNACKWVDQIVPYTTEGDLEDIFMSFKLDCRIIGDEYETRDFTAKDICLKRGIKIIYNSRDHNWSSSELRKRIK
jgi:glycerol-3-phosphate cytidylyltransferase